MISKNIIRYYKFKIFRFLKFFGVHKIWRLFLKKTSLSERNIFVEKYKLIYIDNPKVASSSIKKTLGALLGYRKIGDEIKQLHIKNYPFISHKEINQYKDYYKIAFVRNPYDRLVSCYKNKICNNDPIVNPKKMIYGIPKSFYLVGNFYHNMSFEEFVCEVCKIPDEDAEVHFKSQYNFFVDKQGNFIPNFIGKFENLNEDRKKICDNIGVEGYNLPHLMRSNHKSYKKYYNEKTKNMISKRYKKDLEMFGYNF